jgi:hypothetical protein
MMLEMPIQCRCNAVPLAVLGEQRTYLRANAQHGKIRWGEPNPNWRIGKKLYSIPLETCGI